MILNSYDTSVGKLYKVSDGVEATIKTLVLVGGLKKTSKDNVLYLDQETQQKIPVLAYPVTTVGHNKETITIYDERPYRNKSNVVTNSNELTITRICALLQQTVAVDGMSILKTNRALIVKAFADSIGNRISQRAGLTPQEQLSLKIILSHYYVCMMETDNTITLDESRLITANVTRNIYGTEKAIVDSVIYELDIPNNLAGLLSNIKRDSSLFKLHSLSLKDLIALVGSISFSALGPQVIAAAAEAPCLFASLMYGTASFKNYNKTTLGMVLEPKYNKSLLPSFLTSFNYNFNTNY